ncbi:MAG: alanine racemase [Candidatus Cloacimonetes bacterium]|nr:alanine racemase [Candidatus Cloacimonadota bacterium]
MMTGSIQERSWVEIDLAAFSNNLRFLKQHLHPGQDFLQIVKADAYGHGAREIAEAAINEGAVYLGVANLEEGKLLRIQGIQAPILILSPSLTSEIPAIVEYNLVPGVSDLDFAKELHTHLQGREYLIHVKLDTGMHRSGIRSEEAMELYQAIAGLQGLRIEGIFSHFASSESDPDFCTVQEQRFFSFVESLPEKPRYIHLNNSAASLKGYGMGSNLVRFGILSFGVNTLGDVSLNQHLQPVMTFVSTLSQIKAIHLGESVGYNRDWISESEGRYAVVPVGYADGYDFLLSNRAKVLLRGKLCPVIGRISMDMITIDISAIPEAKQGDSVTLLGNGDKAIRAEQIAAIYQGSAYELLCQIGRRARRYYKRGSEFLHSAPLARRDFVARDFGDRKLNEIISAALSQRLQNDEIGDLIYREILRSFFADRDRDVHYRKDFVHEITFRESDNPQYYQAETTLSYRKVLDSDSFIIACARSDEQLRGYFIRKDVEYRWLLDDRLELDESSFKVSSARINGLELDCEVIRRDGSLEIHCSQEGLATLVGKEVLFEIDTVTLYPKKLHQFSVFISELTQGVNIIFNYPPSIGGVEPVTIFSGQQKNPQVQISKGRVQVYSQRDQWIFPLSGVVFSY